MYTQTIYELSQEAERLLQLALQQLQQLSALPGNSAQDLPESNSAVFSAQEISAQQATLHNELRKVTRLEMVLAIVGTMKAGKSTTINAIVGTEVLPNRNRPMTALPTLIRHTAGQKEPSLHFMHPEPIDNLMQALQESSAISIAQRLQKRWSWIRTWRRCWSVLLTGWHSKSTIWARSRFSTA